MRGKHEEDEHGQAKTANDQMKISIKRMENGDHGSVGRDEREEARRAHVELRTRGAAPIAPRMPERSNKRRRKVLGTIRGQIE